MIRREGKKRSGTAWLWGGSSRSVRSILSREGFRDFFEKERPFCCRWTRWQGGLHAGELRDASLKELEQINRDIYSELLPESYGTCWGNPVYAAAVLGDGYGKYFSFLYAELRGVTVYAYEGRKLDMLRCMELFLEWLPYVRGGRTPDA